MPQKSIEQLKTETQWHAAFQVLKELRPNLNSEKFLNDRERMLTEGYHLFGLQVNGHITCVGSAIIYPHPTHGSECWVHDLVTVEQSRASGQGETIMRHIEEWARGLGCSRVLVHTRFERERAQNFYENHLGYERYAVVFQRRLNR